MEPPDVTIMYKVREREQAYEDVLNFVGVGPLLLAPFAAWWRRFCSPFFSEVLTQGTGLLQGNRFGIGLGNVCVSSTLDTLKLSGTKLGGAYWCSLHSAQLQIGEGI